MDVRGDVGLLSAARILGQSEGFLARSMERLATGRRLNRGADDPAGLIISQQLDAQLHELEAQSRVADRADAVASVADGALGEVSDMLGRAKELAVANASTGGMSDEERRANQMEIDSILRSVDRISGSTRFGGEKLLDGSISVSVYGETLDVKSTATKDIGKVDVGGTDYTLADVKSGGAIDSTKNPEGAAAAIDAAIADVARTRGQIGSFQKNIIDVNAAAGRVALENTAAAYSLIVDTNYASETSVFSLARTMRSAGIAVLRSAMHDHGKVLDLLG